jgi:dUTPase
MELTIKTNNKSIKELYESTSKNFVKSSSFNLFCINETTINGNMSVEIDLGINVSLKELSKSLSLSLYKSKAFWIIPSDYLSKTTLLCVNSPIIILPVSESKIKIKLYNYGNSAFTIKKGHQFFQIVSPDLSIINKVIVE